MSSNTKSTSMLGATILLALGAAAALAQTGPKSSKRIPITKEAAGKVVRVDTVTRVDTVMNTVFRTDTLVRMVTRVDTFLVQPPVVPTRLPGGLYFGVAGGSSAPDGSIFQTNSVGYLGQAQLG